MLQFIISVCLIIWIVHRFTGCKHEWETIKEVTVESNMGGRWSRYHLKCKKCGALKNKDMKSFF